VFSCENFPKKKSKASSYILNLVKVNTGNKFYTVLVVGGFYY
jgi:hypothetical protein